MNEIKPVAGKVYTIAQVINDLDLRDSPGLGFRIGYVKACIQTAHLTSEKLVNSLRGTSWKYEYETDEWVPVFSYVGDESIMMFLDSYLPHKYDWDTESERTLYCPKGTKSICSGCRRERASCTCVVSQHAQGCPGSYHCWCMGIKSK